MKSDFELEVPVVLITYRKLDTIRPVFEQIRNVRPRKLYHISDGARDEQDRKLVDAVINYINANIDWPCEVHRNYATENLGARRRIVSGLDWVFEVENEAIIVEDDVVTCINFFRFCQEMLIRYRDETTVFAVAGGRREEQYQITESYLFTQYSDIWGWATWKRSWQNFDDKIPYWPDIKKSKLLRKKFGIPYALTMERELDMVFEGENDAWDPQWFLYRIVNSGLEVAPAENLVKNIGTSSCWATHRLDEELNCSMGDIGFPLIHPCRIEINEGYEHHVALVGKINYLEIFIRLIVPAKILKRLRLFLLKIKVIR